ncbi:MAG: hypothetical protein ACK4IU_17295 [Tabrizicola flagellatus]|uniref:hypothetical protein n=1 Tax=Tabrizicola flagellatus TaxID=2593021 RepID=UPI00391A9D42
MIDDSRALVHETAMLAQMLIRAHRMVLLALVTVALVATGFAHRMPAPSDEALAFLIANGATPADFCADDLDGDGLRDPHCLACQIAGSADLPPPAQMQVDLELAFHAAVIAPLETRALTRARDPAHRPQGPPVA